MDALQNLPRDLRNPKFRVLIIGRANAGKTSILQRICDTTESPEVHRLDRREYHKRVRLVPSGHFRSHVLARLYSTQQQRLDRLIIVRDY